MDLRAHIPEGCLLPRLACSSQEEAVAMLATAVARAVGLPDDRALRQEILAREAVGDTNVGLGVAIPHIRTRLVGRPLLAVATLAGPAPREGREPPVDVLLLIVGPQQDPRAMLKLLARLVRQLKPPGFLQALRSANSPDEMKRAFPVDAPVI
ncbi:MAG: PTS sugar transporter subunit IIA [bacterium]|nr:PTS sugar transporter subunit IIA [bacterium]